MANVNPMPKGMHTLTINFVIRDCAKAIDFYKQALGAQEVSRFPAPDGKSIWHAELRVGDSIFFVNDEMAGSRAHAPTPESPAPASMFVYVTDCDASFQRAVGAGARSMMPPADMFWGDRTGMVLDPFGYGWTFASHVKDMTPEEMQRAGEEFARKARSGGGS